MLVRLIDEEIASASDDELRARLAALHEANVRAATEDSCDFVEWALPDEETGHAIVSASIHREWHSFVAENRYAALLAPVEHGKSSQIAVGYVLWAIGRNPNLRAAIISSGEASAQKPLRAIRGHIERNVRVQEVFPGLRPSTNAEDSWGQTAITVERSIISRDPTLQALGAGGQIVGSRLDLIVLDDVLDFDNTRTAEQCAKTIEWFETTVLTRLTARGKIIVIGTPWSPLDLLAVLQKRKGWAHRVYSAVLNPDDKPDTWIPTWPERWPLWRLIERLNNTTTITFWRKYLCRITSDATARFKMEWIERAKVLGRQRTFLQRAPVLQPSGRRLACFTGVDLGMSPRKRKATGSADHGDGLTVLFTIAIDERGRRLLVNIESGRWMAPEILSRIADHYARYGASILVESNGAQAFIVQFAQARGIPVEPFNTTGGAKYDEHFGVESLAVELRSELWVFPSGADGQTVDPELSALVGELIHYHPDAHTGDRLMAMWFAREGARSLIASISQHMPTMTR